MIRSLTLAAILFAGLSVLAAGDPPVAPEPKKEKEVVDVAKTAERIVQNAAEAGKRLGAKDPGEETRKLQQETLKDIDALIRKAQEPPSEQNMSGGMSNMGGGMSSMGGGMTKQPMSNEGSGGPLTRNERRERAARQNAGNNGAIAQRPPPMSDPTRPDAKSGMGPVDGPDNRVDSKAAMPRIPDVYKEVWGHLPEKMRQEMDLYFRDRFMPRYSELLRQYYSSLAERSGKNGP
jgi:hypothetical protein